MQHPEEITESFSYTLLRTMITAVILAIILYFLHLFPSGGRSKITNFEMIWSIAFCILFVGHWFELVYINYIKFALPGNIVLLYLIRIGYWFIAAIPLVFAANLIYSLFSHKTGALITWWVFGLCYIGIQLFMHALMHFRFGKSFYNGVY